MSSVPLVTNLTGAGVSEDIPMTSPEAWEAAVNPVNEAKTVQRINMKSIRQNIFWLERKIKSNSRRLSAAALDPKNICGFFIACQT
jgi:hypothetical protein